MGSTMVIKVNYGDTLRRFTAGVNENKELDLDISGLRAKIHRLFNFSPEFDLSLTYIDEDGDVVTLVDDNDLRDVMRQQLKFLRIDVKLKKSDKDGNRDDKSKANSAPLKTYPEQPKSNTGDAEVLKPVGQAISKPSLDLPSKAAFSTHMASDSFNNCPMLVPSVPNPLWQAPDLKSKSQSGSFAPPTSNPSNDRSVQEVLLKFNNGLKTNKFEGFGNSSQSVTAPVQPTDLNSDPFARPSLYPYTFTPPDLNLDPFANNAPKPTYYSANYKLAPFARPDLNLDPSVNNSPKPPPFGVKPIQMSWGPTDSWGCNGISHIGIICDGCEVNPITGPRYKSKVKHDYDLCSICFSKMGKEQDYIRIDRPMPNYVSQFFRAHNRYPRASAPAMPRHVTSLLNAMNQKHDSCFIMDLSISDGTIMGPSTPFTKIWRMQNSGNTPWLQGVKLAWAKGEKFGDSVLAEIKVPAEGVPVNGVLDIAVDFTAPAVPGRYISYWRMETPSGVKFGQPIWVLIEVDDSLNDSLCDSFQGLNLNLPPVNTDFVGPKRPIDINVKPEPVVQVAVEQTEGTVSYPVIDMSPAEIVETKDTVNGVPSSHELEDSRLRELAQMGFNQVELNTEILRSNDYDLQRTLDDLCGVVNDWDPILEELNDMGFTDVETNKKLLKKNNGSIKGVVMDLFAEAKP